MGSESYRKIRIKLIVIFVAAVVAVVGIVLGLNARQGAFIHRNSQIGPLINISGRQRMLSQNIAKTAMLLVQGRESREKLDSLLEVFEKAHYHLLAQNRLLKINGPSGNHLDSLFGDIEGYFSGMLTTGKKLSGKEVSAEDSLLLEKILINEALFLPVMDHIVGEYERLSEEILGRIDSSRSLTDYIIALAVIISAGSVFFVTISTIKTYSDHLEEAQDQLEASIDEINRKVEKLEFLTGAIRVGIWEKSKEEDTEKWSEQLYSILGLEYNEVPGTLEEFIDRVHPSDRSILLDASEVSYKTCKPSTIEIRVRTKSGVYKWVEATGNVKRGADGKVNLMIGGVIDIHDRKVLENQLKAFVDNAPAAIAMFNDRVEYLAASKEWTKAYGLHRKKLIGISHYEIFPEIGEEWKEVHRRCLNGAVERREEDCFEREDGSLQWLKWEVRPWYVSEDQVGGILMLTEDITEAKRKNDELRVAKEQAEKASKAKEEFLATMTHEIRTPLNAIIGMTHILTTEDPKPDQLDNLKLLKFSADNLLTLINDILDISKIESGKLVLDERPFDLYYLVDNIRRSLGFRAKENLVTISTSYDADLPRVFIGDVTRITQILYNLAGNAIKFTKGGTVTMTVNLLSVSEQDEYLFRVSVKDTGIGIPQENQEKIFLSFEQAESGTTRQFGGTGLGLYITKKLLQMMGSDIQLESELNKGSNFFFDIRLKKGSMGIQMVRGLKSDTPDFSSKKIKILIAEDNITNRIIVEKFLAKTGVEFDFVENGEMVLDKLERKVYDLILMDLQMPVMDGYTATIKIRSSPDPYFRQIPIVALTSDAFLDIKDKTLSIGMDDYLSKPFRPRDLFEIINKYAGIVKKAD